MNFSVEQFDGRTYLTCPLTETDPLLMGMLQNNRIPGFAAFRADSERLCYDIHGLRPMQEIFSQAVSRRTLLNSFDAILAALEAAQDYMIDATSVVLKPQYIYLDPDNFRTALICLPYVCEEAEDAEKRFFKGVMFQSIFDYNEPCDHVARVMNYLNGAAFVAEDFRALLRELGAGVQSPVAEPEFFLDFALPEKTVEEEAPAEKTAPQEAEALPSAAPIAEASAQTETVEDPFADWFAPKKEDLPEPVAEEEDPFADWFAPKKEEKTPASTEDVFDEFTKPIVSSRKKPAADAPAESEAPSEPIAFDFDFAVAEKKPTTDAMKLADNLLSAALAAEPAAQEEAPVEEAPVAEKPALGLDAFAAVPTAKSAARLEAEAILDALDLSAPVEEAPVEDNVLPVHPPVVQEEVRNESVRKGGFFSKLRKKEDAPKENAPAVVPYFGSNGETTILNVAQQSKSDAPYLLRSSNQETVVLSKPVFRVGKDKEFSDYCIRNNPAVSRRHANFLVRNGDVFLVDNNSTNHSYVNGALVPANTEIKLTHGDEIRLADEDFMLYCAGTV